MMRKRKPTDLIQLKIRMPETLRAELEEDAGRRDVSINAEVVRRLERTSDRISLLPEGLALVFGGQLAGLLMAIGVAMLAAARDAGHDPQTRDEWANYIEPYMAAQFAANTMLDLWKPLRIAGNTDPQTGVRDARIRGVAAVEAHLTLLRDEMRKSKPNPIMAGMAELLGPMLDPMLEELSVQKKASTETAGKASQPRRKAS